MRSYSSYMDNNLRHPTLILDARADNTKYRNECHANVPLVPVKFLAERFGELNASDPNSLEVRDVSIPLFPSRSETEIRDDAHRTLAGEGEGGMHHKKPGLIPEAFLALISMRRICPRESWNSAAVGIRNWCCSH